MFRILSDEEKELLADWARHPGAEVARKWLLAKRDAEAFELGKRLFANPSSFNAVEVAEQTGRHKGRIEVLNHAHFAAEAVDRAKAKEVK